MLEIIDGRGQSTPVHILRPRPHGGLAQPEETVREIVENVRDHGDSAVISFTERFDKARLTPDRLRVAPEEISRSRSLVRPELLDALEVTAEKLRSTCERQVTTDWFDERSDEFVGEVVRPLSRVGIYVPGGRATYPSSVVMGAVPAQVAGVEGIAVCSPPGPGGDIPEATLAACSVVGIEEVYRMGGAQGIAALAYGTATVRPVQKIVGPGNIYVTLAKRRVSGWVGVDTDAGPTEVAIVAGEGARAREVAADLVAEAEHGPLGTHVLITWLPELVEEVIEALDREVMHHPRADEVENALIEGGRAVLVSNLEHALATADAFAPEHLQLVFESARAAVDRIHNAGSIFVGRYSPVPVGDYVGGTNHVLPSGGAARWSSGLSVRDFVRHIYVSGFERSALERLAPHIEALSEAEGLPAHGRSVDLRFEEER